MTDVQFSEEQLISRYSPVAAQKGGLMELPQRLGIAKTEKEAQIVWVIIVIVCLLLAGFLLLKPSSTSTIPAQVYQQQAARAGLVPH